MTLSGLSSERTKVGHVTRRGCAAIKMILCNEQQFVRDCIALQLHLSQFIANLLVRLSMRRCGVEMSRTRVFSI